MTALTRAWVALSTAASSLAGRVKRGVDWFWATPVGRAAKRFSDRNGNILAGGIAYASLTSIAAGVVLIVSVASLFVLSEGPSREPVLEFIGNAIPGVFPAGEQPGLLDPEAIRPTPLTGLVGAGALIVLARAAMRYVGALRAGVRAMLGIAAGTGVPGIVRDVLALLGLTIIALVGAALQVVAGTLAQTVTDALGDGTVSQAVVRSMAFIVGLIANAGFVLLAYLVLGRARVRPEVLWPTVGATALGIAVLQQATSYFVGSATANPLMASVATIIALLIFVDLVARVIMVGAAWLGVKAQPMSLDRQGESVTIVDDERRPRRRNVITTRRATRRQRPPADPLG